MLIEVYQIGVMLLSEYSQTMQRFSFLSIGFPVHSNITAAFPPLDYSTVATKARGQCTKESVENNTEQNNKEREEEYPKVGIRHDIVGLKRECVCGLCKR